MSNPGRFVWYELLTTDVEAAAKFYAAVVGWSSESSGHPGMDYRVWSIAGARIGGMMAIPEAAASGDMRPAWLGYIQVADVDATIAAVAQAGGAVHMPPTDIADVGRIAMLADPQGAVFYIMTPDSEGESVAFAPGRPGHANWNELHTTDWEAALAFYGAQFGWGEQRRYPMGPMGTYLVFHAGADATGGMFNAPAAPRPMWLTYFCVADIHAANDRVRAAGGTVLQGPMEVPGGDWIIQGRDPQGATFALVARNAA